RMAVPRASAVSFWGNVGDDILFLLLGRYALGGGVDGSDLRLTRSADEAGVRGELRGQGRDGRVLVGAVGRQRDLGRRADRQTEQGDEALRIGLPSVLADDDPAREATRGEDEPGRRPGVEPGRVDDDEAD